MLVKNKFLKESNSKIIGGIFMSKILIKNGTVIDGSRSARFQADVLVEGERIVKIGKIDEAADRVIDATGKIVAPGFIDTHSHSDRSEEHTSELQSP